MFSEKGENVLELTHVYTLAVLREPRTRRWGGPRRGLGWWAILLFGLLRIGVE